MVTKEQLRNLLRGSPEPLEVTFIKANGQKRLMVCTLNPALIPEELLGSAGKAKEHDHLLTVYDVEEDAWRSVNFKYPVEYETQVAD